MSRRTGDGGLRILPGDRVIWYRPHTEEPPAGPGWTRSQWTPNVWVKVATTSSVSYDPGMSVAYPSPHEEMA